MISLGNLRLVADKESGFNSIIEDLENRMTELAEKGGYYIEYSDSDVYIISRLKRYFERKNFEVEQLSSIRIRVYWW